MSLQKLERKYRMQDELLRTRAATQKGNLNTDLALFTAKFPWINIAWVNSYGTDIDTANAFPEDGTVMTDVKVLTADVNASVVEGRGVLQQLFRYAEITYPTDKVKQRVFGQDRYEKAVSDQEKMEKLLQHANGFADKLPYKTDLLAKGYTQPQIDNLFTLSENINAKNLLQEAAKSGRPVTTQERITVHNIVHDRMSTIALCAAEVFVGNPAKIQQYQVYPPAGANTTVEVHVTDGSNNISGLSVQILNYSGLPPQNTDASGLTGVFSIGNSPGDTIDIEVTGPGIINPNPQTFNDKDILEGQANVIEIVVTV
jgi:hypothetical protein